MALIYGKDKVRTFDFDVYITDTEIDSTKKTSFATIDTTEKFDTFVDDCDFVKIGKLDRAVSYSTDTGETIVDNEGVENVIDMTLNFNAEHIAVTNDLRRKMRALDGTEVGIMLVSKKGSAYFCVLLPILRYDYEESSTSGSVVRLPISMSRNIESVADGRIINEF